jgi:hypothetical protein
MGFLTFGFTQISDHKEVPETGTTALILRFLDSRGIISLDQPTLTQTSPINRGCK